MAHYTAPSSKNELFLTAYDEFADAIFRHCYFRLSDRARAKELTQDTFLRAWDYVAKNTEEIHNIRALLYRIANNLIIDEYRKKKTTSLDMMVDTGFAPIAERDELSYGRIEGRFVIDRMLHQLPLAYRQVIVMRYLDNLSPKEIAHILNETETAVSVRIHRGVKKIRELFNA